MNKYLLLFAIITVAFFSCKKGSSFDAVAQAAIDDANIKTYIAANKINATKDPSGLYYSVLVPGTGAYPNATSNVTLSDTGKLLDGTVFDTQTSRYYSLALVLPTAGGVIPGWPIGIPHINKGGTILLMVPSALGYGTSEDAIVAANSVLIYKIVLQGFN